MSSFRRKKATVSSDSHGESLVVPKMSGLKPSIHNSLGQVSSGNTQLDTLLGGGLQLGTLLALSTDIHSNHGTTLMAYMIAEGLSMGHHTLIVASDASSISNLFSILPYNRTMATSISAATSTTNTPVSTEKDGNVDAEKNKDNNLKVAWQYAKYISPSSSSSSSSESTKRSLLSEKTLSQYCCSYDLYRKLQGEILQDNTPSIYYHQEEEEDLNGRADDEGDGTLYQRKFTAVLQGYFSTISQFLTNHPGVSRIYLYDLHQIILMYGMAQGVSSTYIHKTITDFVLKVKMRVRQCKCSVVINYVQDILSTRLQKTQDIAKMAHSALIIETFAGNMDNIPTEFNEFCGFLVVSHLHHLGTLMPYQPAYHRYGLKRDRRKLHIEPLHLPPEESRAFGASGTDKRLEEKAKLLFGADSKEIKESKVGGDVLLATTNSASTDGNITEGGLNLTYEEIDASRANHVSSDATTATASGPRPYRKLDLKGPRIGAGKGGINISAFRKNAGATGAPNKEW